MDFLADVGSWISDNEQLLSGIAAMIVVAGVILSPLGVGIRRYLGGRQARASDAASARPVSEPSPPASADPGRPPTDRPSIAVLPFANMSNDDEQEFLADGMTEDIITGLAANKHFFVVSRNSTFAFKGQSPDIRDVGRKLGVRYVLEGSVRRVGDRIRTTAQLIDASCGDHLWAERYDRPYEEMFAVQDDVIESITGALTSQISSAEFRRSAREAPTDLGAWELVQRGVSRTFMIAPTREHSRESIENLRAAVELDPHYAYARSTLAWGLFSAAINGWAEDPAAMLSEGEMHLQAALDGLGEDPLALFYCGAALVYSGRFERGIRCFERSLEQNPYQPDVVVHLALANGYLGRFEESYELFDRAERLSTTGGMSLAYGWYRAIILAFDERYEEAVRLLEACVEQIPRYATCRVTLGLAYAATGRMDAARAAIEKAARMDPEINLEGLVLNIRAHPDPEKGREREALLREHWPAS